MRAFPATIFFILTIISNPLPPHPISIYRTPNPSHFNITIKYHHIIPPNISFIQPLPLKMKGENTEIFKNHSSPFKHPDPNNPEHIKTPTA